jgi:hypothetical protein
VQLGYGRGPAQLWDKASDVSEKLVWSGVSRGGREARAKEAERPEQAATESSA